VRRRVQSLPALTATRARFSAENGDIVAILNDDTVARYCRTP
jgi:hypothetical protein